MTEPGNIKERPRCRKVLEQMCASLGLTLAELWEERYWCMSDGLRTQLRKMQLEQGHRPKRPPLRL